MYKTSYVLLENKDQMSFNGDKVRVDFYSGITQNLHSVSVKVNNFKGRVYIESTLSSEPSETDWFPIYLTSGTPYRQYPVNSSNPSGNNGGDTSIEAFTFRGNFLYLRARVDREYLKNTPTDQYDESQYGSIEQILINI